MLQAPLAPLVPRRLIVWEFLHLGEGLSLVACDLQLLGFPVHH